MQPSTINLLGRTIPCYLIGANNGKDGALMIENPNKKPLEANER